MDTLAPLVVRYRPGAKGVYLDNYEIAGVLKEDTVDTVETTNIPGITAPSDKVATDDATKAQSPVKADAKNTESHVLVPRAVEEEKGAKDHDQGHRGYEHRGYGHRGYGHRGYGHRGYGHRGYDEAYYSGALYPRAAWAPAAYGPWADSVQY